MKKQTLFCGLLVLVTTLVTAQTSIDYDPNFAADGLSLFNPYPSNASAINDMVLSSGGKIVANGRVSFESAGNFLSGMGISRFLPNGTFDTSFFNTGTFFFVRDSQDVTVTNVQIQNNGKVLALGMFDGIFSFDESHLIITRLNSNGTTDETYGDEGVVSLSVDGSSYVLSSAILPNNQLLVCYSTQQKIFIQKLNVDGSFDTSFGVGGTVEVTDDLLFFLEAYDCKMALLPNGNFIVLVINEQVHFALGFLPNGKIDDAFGIAGQAVLGEAPSGFYYEFLGSLLVHTNGSIFSSALLINDNGPSLLKMPKIAPNGVLDLSFNADLAGNFGQELAAVTSMIELNNGKILGSGVTGSLANEDINNTFFVYNPDGSPSNDFGLNGSVVFSGSDFVPYRSFLLPNGKVLIGGEDFNNERSMLAQFNMEGISSTQTILPFQTDVQITPNPTTDFLRIQSKTPTKYWEIHNALGQMVAHSSSGSLGNTPLIEVGQLPKGNYTIRIDDTAGYRSTKMFVKQ